MKKIGSFFCIYDILVAAYVGLALFLSTIFGFKIDFWIIFQWKYDLTFVSIALLFLTIYGALMAMQTRKKGEDTQLFGPKWREMVKKRFFQWQKLFDLVKVLFLLKITLLIYCNIKQAIPFINSRIYDAPLAFCG